MIETNEKLESKHGGPDRKPMQHSSLLRDSAKLLLNLTQLARQLLVLCRSSSQRTQQRRRLCTLQHRHTAPVLLLL